MDEKGVLKSCPIVSEARDDSLYAMYFGISCAFFTLKYLSKQALNDKKCIDTRDTMLQGSAQLLGLLLWKVQREEVQRIEKFELLRKLEASRREISELKRRRSEDAKANEKVASIYAAQEQSWFTERKKLRQQVGGLLNDLRILDKRKNETISELNGKLHEMEISIKSKDKMLEEEEKKRKELEEKVKSLEAILEDSRETHKREAQEHSSELLKHKSAFIELVSNQRQLEADLGRALRQVEAAKQQLDFVFEEKEEAMSMVEQLSMEIEKMRKNSEQKDKIFSEMMMKSKLEVKLSKPKWGKEERWRTISGSRNERCTLRKMLSRQVSSRLEGFPAERGGNSIVIGLSDVDGINLQQNNPVFDDLGDEVRKEHEDYSLHIPQSLPEECSKFDEAARLDEWVHSEAEKYHNAIDQRHQLELDAFAEQMRLKDDKLEAYQWRLVSAELESKRLQSQIEGLNHDISQLRHHNLKLESLLLDRDLELKTLKDHVALQLNNLSAQKTNFWSKVKIVKKNTVEKVQEGKKDEEKESKSEENSSNILSSMDDIEEKEVLVQSNPSSREVSIPKGFESSGKEVAAKLCLNKRDGSTWKVDLHALGVSYKIKRLRQQLLMLERLTGKKESGENGQIKMKGFIVLLSLLNKQVNRYQSLQEKTDELSKRMGEKDLNLKRGASTSTRTKEETKTLEHFLEDTFQLQRFIVATGQKMMEIQSKIASGFIGNVNEIDGYAGFDMKQLADTMQSLFKDVQMGLEVRITRIIGDLEGTLAFDGIHSWK